VRGAECVGAWERGRLGAWEQQPFPTLGHGNTEARGIIRSFWILDFGLMNNFARFFLIFGAVFLAIGLVLVAAPKIPWLGRLPGDILIRRKNFTFYFPLATSIILSIILTVLFNLFRK